MNETAQLEATLQEQEKIHQQQIYDLEKKQVIDNDRYAVYIYCNIYLLHIYLAVNF